MMKLTRGSVAVMMSQILFQKHDVELAESEASLNLFGLRQIEVVIISKR